MTAPDDLRTLSRPFTVLGAACAALLAVPFLIQFAALTAAGLLAPGLLENALFPGLLSLGSTYIAGLLVFTLILRTSPPAAAEQPPRAPLPPAEFGKWLAISLSVLYITNLFTLMVLNIVGAVRGRPVANPVNAMADFPRWLSFLLLCVAAPLAEEWMFRGLALRRLRPYGEGFAVLASALLFALFHGTFSQYLYAFSVGCIFAYLALKTGCLWQTTLLHGLINFVGGFLPPLLDGTPAMTLFSVLVMLVMIWGSSLLVPQVRNFSLPPAPPEFPPALVWRLFLENPGTVLFVLGSLVLAVTTLTTL